MKTSHKKMEVLRGWDLARNLIITGCPNWDFKNLGCPESLIEKVKIITLIMYINKESYYMLSSLRNVYRCDYFEDRFFRNLPWN